MSASEFRYKLYIDSVNYISKNTNVYVDNVFLAYARKFITGLRLNSDCFLSDIKNRDYNGMLSKVILLLLNNWKREVAKYKKNVAAVSRAVSSTSIQEILVDEMKKDIAEERKLSENAIRRKDNDEAGMLDVDIVSVFWHR